MLKDEDIVEIQREIVKLAEKDNIQLLPSTYKKMFIKEAKRRGFSEDDCYNSDKEMAFEKLKDRSSQLKDKKINDIYVTMEDTTEKLVIYLNEGKSALDSSIDSIKRNSKGIDVEQQIDDFVKHYSKLMDKISQVRNNITSLEESINSINEMSIQDPISSLGNCQYCEMAFDGELYALKRYRIPVVFILLRMKNMTQIRKRYSTNIANTIIKSLATVIYDNIRASDIICRCEEDDFRILLHNTDLEEGKLFLDKMKQMLNKIVFQKGDDKFKVNFVYGISAVKANDTIEQVLLRMSLSV